jgi:hypothetical protein
MKRYAFLSAVLAAVFLMSDVGQARVWVYRPARVYAVRRAVIAPVRPLPLWVPATTTIVAPNVYIGPRGRVRYVAPVQPIVDGVYIR